MKIFGSGFAGLIAAMYNPKAEVFEKNEKPTENHQALLRFRNEDVSEITGIRFRKVQVIKSIWYKNEERQPSPRLVNLYSHKVSGTFENRSIRNVDPVVRYIAPDDFYFQLVDECSDRINFGYEIQAEDYHSGDDIITTLPLSVNAKMLGYDFKTERNMSKIFVDKLEIRNCDMFATVYYPDPDMSVYRASVTGNKLIIEATDKITDIDISQVIDSLGLSSAEFKIIINDHVQPMGKLSSVNDSERRVMIYKMSHDHGVYSLGRFALHKNILLDDVAKDVRVIKSMMKDDTYGISIKDRV